MSLPSPLEAEYDRWDELSDDIEGTYKTQNLWQFFQAALLVGMFFVPKDVVIPLGLLSALCGVICCACIITRRKYQRQQRAVEAVIDAKVHPVSIVHCYEDVQ